MFKRVLYGHTSRHIEYSVYRRDKSTQTTSQEDMVAIEKFYENNGLKHYDLPTKEHLIYFSRTINFIYIQAITFSKHPRAEFISKTGNDAGYGIIRKKAWVFYRGIILYTLDHDNNEYPTSYDKNTITNQKICIKLNYGTHEELNNPFLREIGKCCESTTKFDKACHKLLESDNVDQSINFIKEA